jgi:hypothetical protein
MLASLLSVASASAAVRIQSDPGGEIGTYLYQFAVMREAGESVIIDGPCLSACTLVLSMIPRSRICVTERAQLGFHAAWSPDLDGRRQTNRRATRMMLSTYPRPIKKWIQRRGGLTPRMIWLRGSELAAMYPSCARSINATSESVPSWR